MFGLRRFDLLVNLFLWLAPLGGVGWMAGWVASHEIKVGFINAQGTGVWAAVPRWGLVMVYIIWVIAVMVAIFFRRKLGFVAGISFVLLVVCMGMWVRSHYRNDMYSYFETDPANGVAAGRERVAHEVKSMAGGVRWMRFQYDSRDPKLIFWETWIPEPFPAMFSGKSSEPEAPRRYPSLDFPERNEPARLRELGFDLAINPYWARGRFSAVRTSILAAPYWFLCGCFLPLPLLWGWRHWRRGRVLRRKAEGLCVKCGYDLRASPGRCPECGEEVGRFG